MSHTQTTTEHNDPQKVNWREVILQWQDSDLSVSEFCRQHDWPEHQIHYYRKKYLSPKAVKPTSPSGFASVNVVPGVLLQIFQFSKTK